MGFPKSYINGLVCGTSTGTKGCFEPKEIKEIYIPFNHWPTMINLTPTIFLAPLIAKFVYNWSNWR
jgi:hypothetical protein